MMWKSLLSFVIHKMSKAMSDEAKVLLCMLPVKSITESRIGSKFGKNKNTIFQTLKDDIGQFSKNLPNISTSIDHVFILTL